MADLIDYTNEVQEALGRSYDLPEDVDEYELMGELEALEAEMGELSAEPDAAPSYLDEPELDLPEAPEAGANAAAPEQAPA